MTDNPIDQAALEHYLRNPEEPARADVDPERMRWAAEEEEYEEQIGRDRLTNTGGGSHPRFKPTARMMRDTAERKT